jgi:CHASE3 domain sensor protein
MRGGLRAHGRIDLRSRCRFSFYQRRDTQVHRLRATGASGLSPIGVAFLFLVVMMACFWAGLTMQRYLRDHHRSRETIDSIRVIITLLVTFAALVLGLLISSTQSRFSSLETGLRALSIDIVELDRRLREYGTTVDPIRADMILYTKAAIADTWPREPRPPGDYPVNPTALAPGSAETTSLSVVLNRVDLALQAMVPEGPLHRALAADLQHRMAELLEQRLTLIENARPAISWPFLSVLLFWLMVIFVIVGLSSSQNWLVITVMILAALSLSSSVFLAVELDTPLDGHIAISSAPLRDALLRLEEPPLPAGAP